MGTPLAVFCDTSHCDAKGEHEVKVVSDGQTAYAFGPTTACPGATRSREWLTIECGQPDRHDEPCHGTARFDLTTPGTWTTTAEVVDLLTKYGEQVAS